MPIKQTSRNCKTCKKRTLHATSSFSFLLGVVLSVMTLGVFIPFWGFIMLGDMVRPWRCQQCGKGRMI
jgi:hypothetical protein